MATKGKISIDWTERLKNEAYCNWLTVGQGLLLTCKGMLPYVTGELKTFHKNLTDKGLAPCACPDPYKHDMEKCDWAKELKSHHTRQNPSWNRSNGKKWADPETGYQEAAQLYMRYRCDALEKIDISGLLSLLYNCDHFKVDKSRIESVRTSRNEWAHQTRQELTAEKTKKALQAMRNLLQEQNLAAEPETKTAVNDLEKIDVSNLKNKLDEIYMEVAFNELCKQDFRVEQVLGNLLDRKSHVVSYFIHLADQLNAPPKVKATCESNRKCSCTLELLNLPTVANLSVKNLIEAIKGIKRKDIVGKLTREIQEEDMAKTITETILSKSENEELLEYLRSELDKIPRSPAVKYWYDLGLKLDINRDELDVIKRGSNPAQRLLVDVVYKEFEAEQCTVGRLYQQMNSEHLNRQDIVEVLKNMEITDENDERSMKDVFKPDSDEIKKLCSLLNKDTAGTKNWRHLALAWGIDESLYSSFEPEVKTSPTKILLEWLLTTSQPDITVGEMCHYLASIKRYDAREKLLEILRDYQIAIPQKPQQNEIQSSHEARQMAMNDLC